MELNFHGISTQGLFDSTQVDQYDRYLNELAVKFVPAIQDRALMQQRDKIIDDGYKFIFDYRGLQQSRYQALLQKLNTAYTTTLDRAFATNGAARGGAIPMLRNYWDLWATDAFPNGIAAWYPSPEPPSNVAGGANIKALPKLEITWQPFTGVPTTLNPMGNASTDFGNSSLWTDTTARPGPPSRPAIGENLFLKSFFQELVKSENQEMFSEFPHMPGEMYIAGNASDTFGSTLSGTILINYDVKTQQMKLTLNKATAFYHS